MKKRGSCGRLSVRLESTEKEIQRFKIFKVREENKVSGFLPSTKDVREETLCRKTEKLRSWDQLLILVSIIYKKQFY